MSDIDWKNKSNLPPRRFYCGYCGAHTGPNEGFKGEYEMTRPGGAPSLGYDWSYVYICTYCNGPTFIHTHGEEMQVPGPRPGRQVEHVPQDVNRMYEEARWAMSVGASTAAVMACRKVLMHVAVAEGADEDLRFVQYVDWLEDHHYIPPGGRGWVEQIKDAGNEANHEIPHVTREQAERVLRFTEGLLANVYELRHEAGTETEAESAES